MWNGWINFGMTFLLFLAFVVAVVYYFSPSRKAQVESPKFRMLEDDDEVKPAKDAQQVTKDDTK